MAYENQTFEVILKRMMYRVNLVYPTLDDREGSLIYNALAPAALELAIAYTELDNIRNESFVNTATRQYILLACEQLGIDTTQFEATAGTFKGEFDVEVDIGSRWNCDLFNFTVTEYIQKNDNNYYEYKMICESTGTGANKLTGTLTPISATPASLTYANLSACLIEGEDEKSDDEIRESYFNYANSSIADGNVAQYKRWCEEYEGIGNYKIIPLWNGNNTVKVSILSASNRAASSTLIDEVQKYFDPGSKGMGDGVAPIGAFVTVDTATEVTLSISANITMKNGYSDTSGIDAALTKYFSNIAYEKAQVPYLTIGATILGVEGVESISNLKVNNGTSDINLSTYQIPVLGTTTWTVSE